MATRRWLAVSVFLGLALYLSIAFVTYDGGVAGTEPGPLANAGGSVGFFLADELIATFGAGAFGISFFLMFIGYALLVGRPLAHLALKVLGAVVFTVALATTIQALLPESGFGRSVYPLGGVIGEYFASSLVMWFGGIGSFIILTLLLVASCILATDSLVRDLSLEVSGLARDLYRRAHEFRGARLAPATANGAAVEDPAHSPVAIPAPASAKPRRRRRSAQPELEVLPPLDEDESDGELDTVDAEPDEIDLLLGPLDIADEEELASAVLPVSSDDATTEVDEVDELDADLEPALSDEEWGVEGTDWEYAEEFEDEDDAEQPQAAVEDEDEDDEVALDDDDDDDEVEFEDDEEVLLDDESESLEDEDDDDIEIEDEPEEIAAPPIIRARRLGSEDAVEILELKRDRHMEGKEPYALPPLSLLDDSVVIDDDERDAEIARKARTLEETLRTFRVEAKVVEITRGPTITVYEIAPKAGIKVKSITSLADDISMALKAKTIRIVAPIPGKSTVGIEVPNDKQERVALKELALADKLKQKYHAIPLLLGKDAAGEAIIKDLAEMPHLLIAGQTGSGKSVAINTVLVSLLLTKYPEEVRLILIDPKMVELQAFRNLPHLLTPVVTDMRKAPKILEWAVQTMEERYELLAAVGARNIKTFNDLGEEEVRERLSEHFTDEEIDTKELSLPYMVVVVDELADLMMTSAKEVESSICRLAQKSRAVGIHVILATQRPSVDVITGLIKSNMPSRISFRVASAVDSRTILDQKGAERLLGKGDMLVTDPRSAMPTRGQGALVTDQEIRGIVKYVKDVAKPAYSPVLTQVSASAEAGTVANKDRDPLYEDAIRAVLQSQRGSVSMLQRKLEIGYTRAARLVDFMAEDGIVGAFKGSKAREVMLKLEDWEAQQAEEA
jgi:DNA segregation ATPase FtsK/SpoIIIE, S-DNA-T family